jgi:hypothetical protein
MNKILNKICGVLLLLLLMAGLTACNGESDNTANSGGNINQPSANQQNETTTPQPPTEQTTGHHQHTLEQLSETIEAAGAFWEDFWAMRSIFT